MSWTIHFSFKKASQLLKELGRQVATDRCIMAFPFLIIAVGVIAIIIVKVILAEKKGRGGGGRRSWILQILLELNYLVSPSKKDIRDIPGLAPPAMGWKLVWSAS